MALTHLMKNWKELIQDPPPLCFAIPFDDDIFHWEAVVIGSQGSPYEGIAIFLDIWFPIDFPFKPPRIKLIFPIYHPNISQIRNICMNILSENWTPALTISKVLICITSILADPLQDKVFFNFEAAYMYNINRQEYNRLAKYSCLKHFSDSNYQELLFKFNLINAGNMRKKLLNYVKSAKNGGILAEDLFYPNDSLDQNLAVIEKEAFTFLPSEVINCYNNSKLLYSKIKAAENDIGNWVNELINTGIVELVEDNIEDKLLKELKNKQLWELYFQFLKENNFEKLLQLYSNYCRFFPEDLDKLEEYKNAVEKYGPILVPWKNAFDFEIYDENFHFNPNFVPQKPKQQEKEPISCFFEPKNVSPQTLPFKTPLLNYIIQNSSPKFLSKLQQTCKYLFINIPTPICYKLEIADDQKYANLIEYKDLSAKITNTIPENSGFKNIYFSKVLKVNKMDDPFRFSTCLSRIYQSVAKYILISHQNLTKEELQFLIGSKKVVEIVLEKTSIVDSENVGIMLEEILCLTPKIKKFSIDNVNCNLETAKLISEMPFKNKIELFCLNRLSDENLEAVAFADFIEKNFANKARIIIQFLTETDFDYKQNFSLIVKNRLVEIWTLSERPDLSIHFFPQM